MINLLDDVSKIRKIDKDNTLGSVEAFPDQLRQAWKELISLKLPAKFKTCENIVLAGMGGSALGGRITKSFFANELKLPFEIVTEYNLPKYVSSKTLLIVASYSGNTEETLSCLDAGLKRSARILAITTDGKLGEMIKAGKIPGLIFEPRLNPLGYPKTAIGYSLGANLAVLVNLGLVKLTNDQFQKALAEFSRVQEKNFLNSYQKDNPAKKLANQLNRLIPISVASQHLKGATYCFRNQINEIAHLHGLYYDLPEMTHHLVEAFEKPAALKKKIAYLFFLSDLYHARNLKRYQITSHILDKMRIKNLTYELETKSKLAQVFEVVNLGGFVACYLSVLAEEDPGPEPWIIYLKKKLSA